MSKIKDSTNEKAVTKALDAFTAKLAGMLKVKPDMHGSMTLSVQLVGGVVDRYRITTDETQKCVAS